MKEEVNTEVGRRRKPRARRNPKARERERQVGVDESKVERRKNEGLEVRRKGDRGLVKEK